MSAKPRNKNQTNPSSYSPISLSASCEFWVSNSFAWFNLNSSQFKLKLLLMANNASDTPADDFLEQILGLPTFASGDSGLSAADVGLSGTTSPAPMMLQLNSADANAHLTGAAFHAPVYQLGLSLDQGKGGFMKPEEASASGKRYRDDVVDGRAKNVNLHLFSILLFLDMIFNRH